MVDILDNNDVDLSISPMAITCPPDQTVGTEVDKVVTGSITVTLSPPDISATFVLLLPPSHGTATITPSGLSCGWSYTPSLGFTGQDSFIIRSIASPSNLRCPVEITINVDKLELTITKNADKTYVNSEDKLTYDLLVKNTGTVVVDSAVIKDLLPANTTIDPNTTYIDGILDPGADISTGVTLTSIAVGDSRTIKFTVSVSGATSGQTLSNVADYTADGIIGGVKIQKQGASNVVKTPVIDAKLDKAVDKSLVLQGDTLEYTITFTNSTGLALTSAIIKDSIPLLTTLVPNSTKVNGVLDPLANIVSGIEVGPLAINAVATVSFKVTVDDTAPVDTDITDTAFLDFTIVVDGQTIKDTISSNTVKSQVLESKAKLSMVKVASPKQVSVGDIVKYTITINNTGSLDADNVIVTDILAPELEYADNLTVNGVLTPGDITTGVNIGTVKAGGSVVVTFNVKVKSISANGTISNTTNSVFEYKLPSGTVINDQTKSNTETIEVIDINAVMTKRTDKNVVSVGDSFIYTITIQNTGNVNIDDYILTDILPIQFQVKEITVDGNIVVGDLASGISLGAIAPMQIVIVKIKILVVSAFSTQTPYINVANGLIKYTMNGLQLTKEISATETTGVLISMPKLRVEKSSDVDIAIIGDVVTYTIVATNEGNVPFTDVVIIDLLPSGIDFIEGSVKVNDVSIPTANILTGVHVGAIDVQKSVTLVFKAKVVNGSGIVCNVASADYYYTIGTDETPQYGMQESNKNCITIEKSNVVVTKVADKTQVSLNDIITYTATVKNESESTINSVVFKDVLPSSLMLVEDSVTVDNVVVTNPNLTLGINIGQIAAGATVTIKYKAKVIAGACNGKIKNSAYAEYKYVLSNGAVRSKTSNVATVDICSNIAAFKQLSIDKLCPIPCQKPDMEEVDSVNATGKILKSYVIKTHQGVSNEGQNLSGYKLVVNGVLNIVIEYTANVESQSIHSYCCEIPFGTFIILPTNYTMDKNVSLDIQIEDIDYEAVNCREAFINIMYLVVAKAH